MLWKENIGTLGQIGCELSDNAKMPRPLCRVGCPESDRTSAVYQRNIWVVTKRTTSEHSAELGASCPIMQKTPRPLRRVGRPESDQTSTVYQRNIWVITKRTTSEHSPKLGTRCPIIQNTASIARSWTSGVRRTSAVCRRNIWVVTTAKKFNQSCI